MKTVMSENTQISGQELVRQLLEILRRAHDPNDSDTLYRVEVRDDELRMLLIRELRDTRHANMLISMPYGLMDPAEIMRIRRA